MIARLQIASQLGSILVENPFARAKARKPPSKGKGCNPLDSWLVPKGATKSSATSHSDSEPQPEEPLQPTATPWLPLRVGIELVLKSTGLLGVKNRGLAKIKLCSNYPSRLLSFWDN